LHLVFLAGFGYALASVELFFANVGDAQSWRVNLAIAVLMTVVALGFTARALLAAFVDARHRYVVVSLAFYWLVAFVGLCILAVNADPLPFLSTLVSAIISVMVAWLVANILREPGKAGARGWWRVRRPR
jgi:hypothetical protein